MAGMRVVVVDCDGDMGNVDVDDLKRKAVDRQRRPWLSTLMITYPSTHGVFEATAVRHICDVVHELRRARSTSTGPTSMPWWAWPGRAGSAPMSVHI